MNSSSEVKTKGKELTGRKVLLIFVTFFGVVFTVNFYMAYSAVSTYPGLEVRNSYAASQVFERNRAAQLALGWDVSAVVEGQTLRLEFIGADGKYVTPASIESILGKATHARADLIPIYERTAAGYFLADIGDIDIGNWKLRLKAHADDGTLFQQRIVIYVSGR